MRKGRNYPVCSKCDAEINPNLWDGCEKYYKVGGEILCADCFKDWLMEWIGGDLDEVARALEIPVVEVRA